jgi:hypothetical protein
LPVAAFLDWQLAFEYQNAEDDARDLDAATFLLVGFPVGSMTHETVPYQVADLKGRIAALGRLQTEHGCKVSSAGAGK